VSTSAKQLWPKSLLNGGVDEEGCRAVALRSIMV
jgi:hypothetical protein